MWQRRHGKYHFSNHHTLTAFITETNLFTVTNTFKVSAYEGVLHQSKFIVVLEKQTSQVTMLCTIVWSRNSQRWFQDRRPGLVSKPNPLRSNIGWVSWTQSASYLRIKVSKHYWSLGCWHDLITSFSHVHSWYFFLIYHQKIGIWP